MKVLIVEDDITSQELFKYIIIKFGYKAIVTDNGKDALNLMKKNNPPRLLIVDWMMPIMNGVDFIKEVRKHNSLYPPYIIMVTCRDLTENKITALKSGADDYITKPFNRNDLITRINVGLRIIRMQDNLSQKINEIEEIAAEQKILLNEIPTQIWFLKKNDLYGRVNRAHAAFHGLSADKMTGKNIKDVLPQETAQNYILENKKVFTSKEKLKTEEYVKNFKNEKRILKIYRQPIFDKENRIKYVVCSAEDITKQKKAQKDLKEREEQLRAIFDSAKDSIFIKDKKLRYVSVNSAMEKLFNLSKEELLQKTDIELFGEKATEHMTEIDKRVLSGETVEEEDDKPIAENEFRTFHVIKVPIYGKKREIIGLCGIARDITERKKAIQEKIALEKQMMKTQRLETVGTLAGGIAHDFNNIITPILGYSDIILEEIDKTDRIYDDIKEIYTASKRAKELIYQILNFSRQTEQKKQPVFIQPIIKEAIKLLRPSIPATIEIEKKIDENAGKIFADPTAVHQLIVNLCTNAFHAMEKEGGTLTIELGEKFVKKENFTKINLDTGSYIYLKVTDTGRGMPENIKEKIFDPFYTTKSPDKGTGLGLSVVLGIVKSHNGDIVVNSQEGKETTFEVFFPILKKKYSSEKKEIKSSLDKGNREKVMVVDDKKEITKFLHRLLTKLGYKVFLKNSSHEALLEFKKNTKFYDLIITDLTMPELTGIQLSKKIRKINKNIPIILMTGYGNKLKNHDIENNDITTVIEKPINCNKISELVKNVLKNKGVNYN